MCNNLFTICLACAPKHVYLARFQSLYIHVHNLYTARINRIQTKYDIFHDDILQNNNVTT